MLGGGHTETCDTTTASATAAADPAASPSSLQGWGLLIAQTYGAGTRPLAPPRPSRGALPEHVHHVVERLGRLLRRAVGDELDSVDGALGVDAAPAHVVLRGRARREGPGGRRLTRTISRQRREEGGGLRRAGARRGGRPQRNHLELEIHHPVRRGEVVRVVGVAREMLLCGEETSRQAFHFLRAEKTKTHSCLLRVPRRRNRRARLPAGTPAEP